MPDFLTPAESDKANDQSIVDPEAPLYVPAEDVPEGVPADALPSADVEAEETTASADEIPPAAPLTTERALNIAFGAGLLLTEAAKIAAQKLGDQAEFVQNNAPAILDALEEKGKPVREAVLTKLKDAVGFGGGTFDGGEANDAPQTSGDVDAEQELARPSASVDAPFTPAVPFVAPVIANGSAEAEISALERRVRELEQEVSKPLTVAPAETPAAAPAPVEPEYDAPDAAEVTQEITMEAGNDASETPADAATYDFAPNAPETLADSDYAVSETPDEIVEETIENDYERAEGETGDKKDAS